MKPLLAALLLAAGLALADVPREPPPAEPVPTPAPAPAPAPAPQHPAGIEKAMGAGVIQGGWEYVYASYALAVLGVVGYGVSLMSRRPKGQPEKAS
jgi:hypothetical protein